MRAAPKRLISVPMGHVPGGPECGCPCHVRPDRLTACPICPPDEGDEEDAPAAAVPAHDLASLGPPAWEQLHRWADDFKATVGDGCGCGDFAVSATRAMHDAVNIELGKRPAYIDDLRRVTQFYTDAMAKIATDHLDHAAAPPAGVYVAFPLDAPSAERLSAFVTAELSLPAPTWDLHATTVHHRAPIPYRPVVAALDAYQASPASYAYEVFDTKDGKRALVLTLSAPALTMSHEAARALGATWDHAEFIPHVTLSYDYGARRAPTQLPTFPLRFVREEVRPLEESWAPAAQAVLHIVMEPLPAISDPWGSRCRDDLGRWIDTAECGPFPIDGQVRGSDRTFAYGPDDERRYEFRYELVEADDLVASHDEHTFVLDPRFPPELQPRLRGRAATRLQVQRMAQNINPLALLTEFHTLDRGAPIVGPDMVVESGNGRVMALKLAAADFPDSYGRYRRYLTDHAGAFGQTAQDVGDMERPVLVRVRLSDVDRVQFSREGNASAAISVSSIERAKVDAENVTGAMLAALQVGENQSIKEAIRSPANRGFVAAFLATVPENERASLVDAQGQLNMDGVRRIALAVFLAAFPGTPGLRIAEKAFESNDLEVRNVTNGISRALGPLAQAETLARDGERDGDLSIGDSLARTVNVLAVIKRSPGMTVEKYLAQGQFERELTPFEETVLQDIAARSRSGKRTGELLASYAQRVIDMPPPSQGALFGPQPVSREEVWAAAVRDNPLAATPAAETLLIVRDPASFQGETLLSRDPRDRVDWGNVGEQGRVVLWSWAPFRDVIAGAVYGKAAVSVYAIGFTGREFQLVIQGRDIAAIERMEASFSRAFARFGRRVHTGDPNTLIWEIIVPIDAGEPLRWTPQPVMPRDREAPAPQPRLFQGKAAACRQGELSDDAVLLDISGSGEFIRERVADPAAFDAGSYRTVERGDHRVIVGCPKGHQHDGECAAGTRAQSVLHPRSEERSLVGDALEQGIPVIDDSMAVADDLLKELR